MKSFKRYIVVLVALILVGCGPKDDQLVNAKAAFERQASGELLLDIRELDEYKEYHIPGSISIPYGRLKSRMAELESYKGKTIMVIDHSGLRAPRAWEQLKKAGYAQVRIVKGGILEWQAAGLPLEKVES